MERYTEAEKIMIRDAVEAFCSEIEHGFGYPLNQNWYSDFVEWFNKYTAPEEVEVEKIPITLAIIKATCGWSKFCDVTGSNLYMLNEFSVKDSEIFEVEVSKAKQLGII